MPKKPCRCHIVDLAGIARHMRVERLTPQQWKQRGLLPPVDFPEIGYPLWYADTIRAFAGTPGSIRAGRRWFDNPHDDTPDELLPPAVFSHAA